MAREYLPYLRLLEYVGMVVCVVGSIPLLTILLYRAHFARKSLIIADGLSRSMLIFLWTHLLNCLLNWPNPLMLVALWQPTALAPSVTRAYWLVAQGLMQKFLCLCKFMK